MKVKINFIVLLESWSDGPLSYESGVHVHCGSDRFHASGPTRRLPRVYNRYGGCCSTFPGCSFRIRSLISLMPGVLVGDGSQLGVAFDQKELLSPWSHTLPGDIHIKWLVNVERQRSGSLHQFKTSLMGPQHSRVLSGGSGSLCSNFFAAPLLLSALPCCHDSFRSIVP